MALLFYSTRRHCARAASLLHPGRPACSACSYGYTYDVVGNRLTQTASGTVISYTYDIANRLTNVNGQSYTWDDNGNLLNDGMQTYTYDQANRLKTAVQGGTTYSFGYNGVGDRLSQTVGVTTTHYVLDPAAGLTQVLSDGTNTYLYGNDRLGQYQAEMQYFGADGLGSVRQLYDATGQVLANNRYDPYGSLMSHYGEATSVFAFTGEQLDAATGLEYLRARYYSPEDGRFTTRDTWQGDYTAPLSLNKWNYVQANPVVLTDPSGRVAPLVIIGVILIGAGTVALIDEVNQVNSYAQKQNIGFWEAWNSPRLELDQGSMVDSAVKVGFLGCLTVDAIPALIGFGGLTWQQLAMWANNPQMWQRGAQWLNISGKINVALWGASLTYSPKIKGDMRDRGWTQQSVENVVARHALTRSNPSIVNRANGNPVTYYYRPDGHYVVVDDITKAVVQVSNTFDAGWIDEMTNQAIRPVP